MFKFDVNLNATLEVDDDTWFETLEAFDGDEDEALGELLLEYSLLGLTVHGVEKEVVKRVRVR